MLKHCASILATGLLLSGAALGAFMTVCRLKGYEILSVQSDSMVPAFRKGDAALIDTRNIKQLIPGQVVSYRSVKDDQVIVSHRLLNFDVSSGLVTTQGDALNGPDPAFSSARLVGRVEAVLPHFGTTLSAIRHPAVLAAAVYLPGLTVIAGEVRSLSGVLAPKTYRLPLSDRRKSV